MFESNSMIHFTVLRKTSELFAYVIETDVFRLGTNAFLRLLILHMAL